MNSKILGLACTVSSALLMGCASDVGPLNAGTGSIKPSVEMDTEVFTTTELPQGRAATEPVVDDLKLKLSSVDGSYSKEWPSLSQFPTGQSFKVGEYKMEASYGALEDEGFEKPYYYGESTFSVTEGNTTDVSLTAKLANTMVSITYTDAFKNYFTSYSAELHSAGGKYVTYAADETRPAYLRPGNITLSLSITKPNGTSATIQPAAISDALAQHHYRLTIDVNNGAVGDAVLAISFDDALAQESVSIDLSDELMNAPAPVVATEGVAEGETLNLFEGDRPSSPVRFVANARGGLGAVTLTTQSSSLIAQGWPAEVDLMTATEEQKARMTSLGLNAKGLWHNPDQMALIDLTEVISHIKYMEGNTSSAFTLVVKDKMTKVNEPKTISVETSAVEVALAATPQASVGVDRATLQLTYNGSDFEKNVSFQTRGADGTWADAEVLSVEQVVKVISTYRVIIKIPAGNTAIPVRVLYRGSEKASATISRETPDYTVSVDAYASKAIVKLSSDNASSIESLVSSCSVYLNGSKVAVASTDAANGLLTLSGLNPGTEYTIKTSLDNGAHFSKEISFTTEAKAAVPNGDFEDIASTIKTTLNSGGQYYETQISWNPYQNKTTFDVSEPKNWASVNAKTFCTSASNQNTWYMQPSTVVDAGTKQNGTNAVKVSNVAWDLNGPSIGKYNFTWGKTESGWGYSHNAPSSIANKSAGRLFLGSYSYTASGNTERYVEGIGFTSRPSALNGYYRYTNSADNSDTGLVTVEVIGVSAGAEVVIASGSKALDGNNDFTAFSIPLTYKTYGIKASKLKIMISSSKHVGTIQEETAAIKTVNDLQSASSVGNTLWVDNLTFSY